MMDDEELFTQMGLILTQLRFARRALEDVERSTARYGGFAFAGALSEGPRFGEPPLLSGALRVYVVNIGDLTPGSGLGGFVEGLLGGIGRFFGGLFGGIAGGTISGVLLPLMIGQIERIVTTIDQILSRLGLRGAGRPAGRPEGAAATRTEGGEGGGDLASQLTAIRETVNAFTALFQAAGGETERAARTSALPTTPAGERWLAMLHGAQGVIAGILRVVEGLTLLLPIVLGTLVLFIARLDAVKLAVVEMLQFIMRNFFLLRGVVVVTLADTAAFAANLAANLLGILAGAVERILSAVFRMVGHVLDGAMAALGFLAGALQRTVDGMLRWLVGTLGAVLTFLGDLRVFRVLVHVIRILPAVLPPLYELLRGRSSPPLTPDQLRDLREAARMPIPEPTRPGTPGVAIPPFPNIAEALVPPTLVGALSTALSDAARGLTGEVRSIFGTAGGALFGLGRELNEAAEHETEVAGTRLETNLRQVEARSADLAEALSAAQRAAQRRPETGLEGIARAYEQWLGGGGLERLLTRITEVFQHTSPAEPGTLPRRIAAEASEPVRAMVEIENVTIRIEPPAQTGRRERPAESEPERAEVVDTGTLCRLLREWHELRERGFRMGPDALYDHLISEPILTS